MRTKINRLFREISVLLSALTMAAMVSGCSPTAPTPEPTTPTPMPTPTPEIVQQGTTPTPQATRTPEPTEPASGPIFLDAITTLNVDLPEGWQIEKPGRAQLKSAEGQLRGMYPTGHGAIRGQLNADGENPTILVAAKADLMQAGVAAPRLTILTYPRHQLSLEDYVSAASSVLAEHGTVERAGMLFDIREDSLPAGMIEFRQTTGSGDEIGGYQLIRLSPKGEKLIVLTFTGAGAEMADLIPEFNKIAGALSVRDETSQ